MPIKTTIIEYSCEWCARDFYDDEDEAIEHEESCDENPSVIVLKRSQEEERQKRIMLGLEEPAEEPIVPPTLKPTKPPSTVSLPPVTAPVA